MKIQEVRLIKLKQLIAEKGSVAAVANAAGTAAAYLSQITTGVHLASGKTRTVGTQLARKLEAGCGKPDGWMDRLDDDKNPDIAELLRIYSSLDDNLKSAMLEQVRLLHKIQKSTTQ